MLLLIQSGRASELTRRVPTHGATAALGLESYHMPTALRKIPTSGGPRAQAGRKNPRAKIAVPGNRGIKVVRAITILQPANALYRFWREVTNLPQVVHRSVEITAVSPQESHWKVRGPAGRTVEWDALIINDEPDRLIAWRSREGGDVENAGSVRFEKAPGGTEVTVALEYNPPGGKLGAAVATLTRAHAASQIDDALRRFKALMEAGKIPRTEDQSAGGPPRDKQHRK